MQLDFGAPDAKQAPCNCERCQQSFDLAREKAEARELLSSPNSAPAEPLSKEIGDFEAKTAIGVTRSGDKFEYKMSYNGKDKLLATTDASTDGLKEAEKKIAELVAEKEKELERTFNVSFSKAGDDVVKQWVEKADCSWERGDMVKARSPNLIELYGIQATLYRCQPSDTGANGQGVKFHFLESNYYKEQPVLAYFVQADKDGRTSVYFEPGSNKRKPATEADSDRFNRDHLFSVEALTTHELSHNHQAKTGWHTAEKENLARSIGWIPFHDAKSGSSEYMLRGKNGEFYRYGKDHCKDSNVWVQADKDGNPLNDKGEKSGSFKDAKQFKKTEIAERAQVKPLTYYFPNPTEMFAEGLMLYRLGGKIEEGLLRDSPQLYKAAKERDQVEIDQRWGKNEQGESKYIRGVDGLIKDNTAEERRKVEGMEEQIKNASKPASKNGADTPTRTASPITKVMPQFPVIAPLFHFSF